MTFCYKCGKELEDGSVFCPACGANQNTANQAPETSATPTPPADTVKTGSIPFAIPSKKKLIAVGATFIAFLFSVIFNWAKVSFMGYSEGFSIFESNMFELSTLMGIAKIFTILSIIVFIVYVIAVFVDINKLVKLPFDVRKLSKFAYFACLALALFFSLFGIITTEFVGISFGWFVILIFGAIAAVLEFTDMINKFLPNIK